MGRKTKIVWRVALALWVLLCAATAPILLPLIPIGLILFRLLMWDYRDVPDFRRSWWWHVRRWTRRLADRVPSRGRARQP